MPVRIYDIAKKHGLESKEIITKAKELGIAAINAPPVSARVKFLEEMANNAKIRKDTKVSLLAEAKALVAGGVSPLTPSSSILKNDAERIEEEIIKTNPTVAARFASKPVTPVVKPTPRILPSKANLTNKSSVFLPLIKPRFCIIFDTCFLRKDTNPLRHEKLIRIKYHIKGPASKDPFDFSEKLFFEENYVVPTLIIPLQVKNEIINAHNRRDANSKNEAKLARGHLGTIKSSDAYLEVDLDTIEPYEQIEKSSLGPDSLVDKGILALARHLTLEPNTVVFIETKDGGIKYEAVELFKQGHLIGCDNYVENFVKKLKEKLDPCSVAFRPKTISAEHRLIEESQDWKVVQQSNPDECRIVKTEFVFRLPPAPKGINHVASSSSKAAKSSFHRSKMKRPL